jgi:RimJ/RimL family protein N-acetyltransferase
VSAVALRPWAPGDEWLLQRLLGDPEMTRRIGGPQSRSAIRARHERYLVADPEKHGLFAITAGRAAEAVGWVGYWESEWRGELVRECGWNLLPEAQGRGVATAAAALMIDDARTAAVTVICTPSSRSTMLPPTPSAAGSASSCSVRSKWTTRRAS